jgi:predicted amidohydrolase YtcJ
MIGGTIWTAERQNPYAEAILIENDIIAFVGSNLEFKAHIKTIQEEITIINLEGRFVVPGFIDSHVHSLMGGEILNSINLKDVKTKTEFVNKIGEYAKTLKKGEWIRGGNWDHINWGGELPDRSLIDSVTPDNPVWLNRHEGHTYLANTVALKIAGILDDNDSTLKNIEDEDVLKTKDGKRISGIFKDNAIRFVYKSLPLNSYRENKKYLELAMDLLASYGVTSVHHMTEPPTRCPSNVARDYEFFKEYVKSEKLRTRIYCAVPLQLKNFHEKNDSKMLKTGAFKAYSDGSIGSLSAAFSKDYLHKPGYKGNIVNDPDYLFNRIKEADDIGFQVFIHAIGDKGISSILDIFEKVVKVNGVKNRRWRIEHAQHILPKDIPRFKKLGVIASMQPAHLIDDSLIINEYLDTELARSSFQVRSLLTSGAIVTFGSDWFVSPPDPINTIDAAVNRVGSDGSVFLPEERISVEEALYCSTYNAAYSSFEDNIKGSIRKGKLADLAVLDRNILQIDPKDIKKVKVVMTILGGEIIYQNKNLMNL